MARSRELSFVTQLTQIVGPNMAMAPMIVPPDGGWGWVIVMVGILGACFVDGCTYCFYLFREPMSKELHCPEADISYLSSLNTGFYFVGAVFACSFGNQWGFRATMLLGAIVTSLSYASGYFLQDILFYHITIGVMAGLGCGFMSVGAGLPTGFYFDKKRSIALGITSCGSGLGGVVMPNIVESFMKHYGWRNTFLFEGGIMLSTIFLAILIRPLKPVMVVIDVEGPERRRTREDSFMDYSAFRIPPPQNPDNQSSSSAPRYSMGEPALRSAHPTIAQIMNEDTPIINIRVREYSDQQTVTRLHQMTQSRMPTVLQPSASNVWANNVRITQEPLFRQSLPWYKCGCCRSKYISMPGRPLTRNDLYYTGHLKRLPEYTATDRDLEYHMQVTKVPTYYQTVQDLTKNYSIWCCHNILTGLRQIVDYTMFKSPAFTCFALCGFCIYIAFYLPYVFGKVHLENIGAGSYASTLISLIGLGSMVGRFLSGMVITACPMFDALSLITIMNFISAISTTAMILHDNLYFKGVCLFVSGFSIGFYVPLRSLVIVDFFGLERLTAGTGVLIICVGVGSFLGPPIAENVMDFTSNINAPFYVYGIAVLIATMLLLPMKCLRRWEVKREERKKSLRRRLSSPTAAGVDKTLK